MTHKSVPTHPPFVVIRSEDGKLYPPKTLKTYDTLLDAEIEADRLHTSSGHRYLIFARVGLSKAPARLKEVRAIAKLIKQHQLLQQSEQLTTCDILESNLL